MDNREKILETALGLFSARGYDAVGVQEIVDAAEITKPTLYHYFGSKKGLLEAVLEINFELLISQASAAAVYQGDLPLTLKKLAETFFRFAEGHKCFYRMQLALFFAAPESEAMKAVAPYNQKIYSIFEELFSSAARDHGNMKGRHGRYALTFLGLLNNYISLYLNGFIELSDKAAFEAVHQFSHGIYS